MSNFAGDGVRHNRVDPLLSKQDLELIRALRDYTPRIAVVLTKADLLSELETEEVAAFVMERLREEFGVEFRVFPFSIRPACAFQWIREAAGAPRVAGPLHCGLGVGWPAPGGERVPQGAQAIHFLLMLRRLTRNRVRQNTASTTTSSDSGSRPARAVASCRASAP